MKETDVGEKYIVTSVKKQTDFVYLPDNNTK